MCCGSPDLFFESTQKNDQLKKRVAHPALFVVLFVVVTSFFSLHTASYIIEEEENSRLSFIQVV